MPRAGKQVNEAARARGPSIVLVDDHPLWRETLRKVIEMNAIGSVIAEASDGDEAIEMVRSTQAEMVVMDMALPTVTGVEATARITADRPGTRVLVISSFEDRRSVIEAVRAGASGYLLKTAGAADVADAVRRVANGELVFPPSLAKVVLDEFQRLSQGGGAASLTLALIGDSPVYQAGLSQVLAKQGHTIAASLESVDDVSIVDGGAPDVVIVDFHAGPDSSLSAAARLRESHPAQSVLVLVQDEASTALAVELVAGGDRGIGILLRDRVADVEELTSAIERVAAGGSAIDGAIIERMVADAGRAKKVQALTAREREVLAQMAEGHSNQAISERLFLSGKTLEKHIRAIFSKLGLDETADVHRRVLAVLAFLRSA